MARARTLLSGLLLAVAGLLLPEALPLFAQQPAVEWSGVFKRTRGTCDQGATVAIVERDSVLHYQSTAYGKVVVDMKIPLAADGSAKSEYRGVYGVTTLEVPAGRGKRPLIATQVHGICQWTLEPK
jgi:hypothetical protein